MGEFTTNTAGTDTTAINQSLDTLSDTIERIAPQLGPTFDGLSRLSKSLNSRNESLSKLLDAAADVTGVLSERSAQVNTLLLNANDLLAVLQDRRYAIVNLLASTTAVAQELSGMVADNEQELAPTLERLSQRSTDTRLQREEWRELVRHKHERATRRLAAMLDVSPTAMHWRLVNLGLIPRLRDIRR